MATKFKTGDRFKVVKQIGDRPMNDGWTIGTEGTITGYYPIWDDKYPYEAEAPGCEIGYFNVREIEKLRKDNP